MRISLSLLGSQANPSTRPEPEPSSTSSTEWRSMLLLLLEELKGASAMLGKRVVVMLLAGFLIVGVVAVVVAGFQFCRAGRKGGGEGGVRREKRV
jgi:hypothetical protein